MRGNSKGRQPENRAAIIDAAIEVISRSGLAGARLKDVAAEAKVSVGTVQHYFGSKEKLVDEALYSIAADTVNAILRSSQAASSQTAWEELCGMLATYREWGDYPKRARMWLTFAASGLDNPAHRRLIQSVSQQWVAPFAQVIRRGTQDGEFHPVAPIDDIVDILLRLTDGYTMSQAAGFLDAAAPTGRDITARFETVAAALLGVPPSAQG